MTPAPLTLDDWRLLALDDPRGTASRIADHCASLRAHDDPAFIAIATPEQIRDQIDGRIGAPDGAGASLPLFGVPVAVKDNIDVARWPTTAACPDFARIAARDAGVIARLRQAGAVIVAKTNLDQFATGLVGTRSPYGVVPNAIDPRYLAGGSSSGSASCVARGLVPLALGTDTAGSGRVPAGFNNLVGLKPTRGLLSTDGVVPACRTLDCVSIFALQVGDAVRALHATQGFDPADPYSRHRPADAPADLPPTPRIGVPATLEFFGDERARDAFDAALARLDRLGVLRVAVDFTPFAELAALLYAGPWVHERKFAARDALDGTAMDPVVRRVIAGAQPTDAAAVFAAEYRRAALAARIAATFADCDALLVPTTPTHYRLDELAADPVGLNSRLGTYTNFANLADLCALALPGPWRTDGLPAGITLLAPAWHDEALAAFGVRWESALAGPLGATGLSRRPPVLPSATGCERIAVVGAHLSGMPLNGQLTGRGARFVATARTAPRYRLFALADTVPPKPGLLRVDGEGHAIEVELWDLPTGAWGAFVAETTTPLGIGTLELSTGERVKGFLCESWALAGATDISASGGWRRHLAQRNLR